MYDRQFNRFRLTAGEYIELEPNVDGTIGSEIFPGLWLEKSALLARDVAKVLEVVQPGIAASEHQAFVKQLFRE